MKSRPFLLAFVALLLPVARGQFYAPETDYHDNVQRVFPVEAARVLAWVQNSTGAKIANVDFSLETTAEHESVWTLRWRDAAGKTLREKTVRYPETALTSGPDYYRDVVRQIASDDWKFQTAPPDNAATAFWQGAEAAGLSRLEGLKAAGNLVAEKPKLARPADCARLAGILVHSTLPRFGNPMTIDSVLLARGAAWLCLAEALSREKYDAAWSSILALAWREKAAAALWSTTPKKAPEKWSAAERFWGQLFSKPAAKDLYLFAARPANRTFAMPALIYPSALASEWTLITIEVAPDILGPELLARSNEYLPSLVMRGGVNGGHFGSDAPGEFLRAYERFIRDFQPAALDATTYRDVLNKIPAAKSDEESDLAALQRLAPLINQGLDEGSGALTPVAHVTARDLLGYGWEMSCLQFGYEHLFLAHRLGDPDSAKQVAKAALGAIKGIDVFFPGVKETALAPLGDLSRLQGVHSSMVHDAFSQKLPVTWTKSADTYLRRVWLSRVIISEAFDHLVTAKGSDELLKANLERLINEGGPQALHSIAVSGQKNKYPPVINRVGLRNSLSEEEPLTPSLGRPGIWERTGSKGDVFGYAQALEKSCWDNCLAMDDSLIMLAYLQCNAVESAKRFYEHIRPFITEAVGFSNLTGPQRFALAWWEKDDAGMKQALKDSSTYSWSDLKLQTCYAVQAGDLSAAEQIIGAMTERYSDKDGRDTKIKEYLALVPALKDPNHADHTKAVDSFPHAPSWRLLQWILLKQADLKEEEAVRFLGGDKAPAENRIFIAYVKRDNQAFEKEFNQIRWKGQNGEGALIALMRNDLLEIKPPAEQPDLMPPDAKPMQQLIAAALNSNTAADTKTTLDFTKYKTAEEFWGALEKLREQPREHSDSPQDMMRRIRSWLQARRTAAEAFLKAYPNDSHRHDARLIAIDSDMQLSQLGDRTAKNPDKNELQAIAAAPDADSKLKGEAEFFLVMLDAQSVEINSPHTVPPFQQALASYLEKYPDHARTGYVASLLLQLLSQFETPSTEPLLKKLAANPNEQISAQAKAVLQQRQFMTELKKKPLELKFTAVDGTAVDAAKLRGKVVLLDFWASWCGPCMAEAPNVVATYKKLHDQGFEIIGISLDEDRDAMDKASQRAGMTWPQSFDGKGWQTEIAQRFGIRSIPSTWLFDKHGKLREHGLRGEELEARIENLLKEK